MKFLYARFCFFSILLCALFSGNQAFSQITITGTSDSVDCYRLCDTLTAHVIGDVPINSGITQDDYFPPTVNPIGFTFSFYGLPYTGCLIGPNGNICFNDGENGMPNWVTDFTNWNITGALADPASAIVNNSICGPWCDIDI